MQIDVANYEKGWVEQRNAPEAPIREFVSWLMRANRWRLEDNPDITLEKVWKLRLAIDQALRDEVNALPPEPPKKKAVAAK